MRSIEKSTILSCNTRKAVVAKGLKTFYYDFSPILLQTYVICFACYFHLIIVDKVPKKLLKLCDKIASKMLRLFMVIHPQIYPAKPV